ncbi:predicted protein [Ostreococcus lucimarinus CCE9901]|uniref:Uncharacterized protein n=1 Tax=Ostreococcus lucimarinus (strain CCE9901) TaxID=436017 RepID=A4S7M3_OSTLU|nr:predicted protein [Ostreococcus lucimarinus CCE9901]ABO99773.1 predicted protein [Ostreococcus lucimarinus CCE9901]|eukprot:XP_001421480.1 predicted protein [Ostreococcus lucimarinus CCE9901]
MNGSESSEKTRTHGSSATRLRRVLCSTPISSKKWQNVDQWGVLACFSRLLKNLKISHRADVTRKNTA